MEDIKFYNIFIYIIPVTIIIIVAIIMYFACEIRNSKLFKYLRMCMFKDLFESFSELNLIKVSLCYLT